MAAHLQLCHLGIFIPDGALHCAGAAKLLLLENSRLCPGAIAHTALRGAQPAVQNTQQRRFSRAVRPGYDKALAAVHRMRKVLHQPAAAQSNANILCHHKVVIRRDIEGKAKFQPLPLAFGGRSYLQLFQLLAAALCHFGGGGPYKVSRNIIFQLFCLFHIGVVLLLPQGVSRLPLGQIGGRCV